MCFKWMRVETCSTIFIRDVAPSGRNAKDKLQEGSVEGRALGLFDPYINPMEPKTSWGLVISFWMPSSLGRAPKARPMSWVM
jgi:hypothetical protein